MRLAARSERSHRGAMMSRSALLAFAFFFCSGLASGGTTRTVVVSIAGMDCGGCATAIQDSVGSLPFVAKVSTSFVLQKACISLSGELDESAVATAVAGAEEGLGVGAFVDVPECPEGLRGELPDPWLGRAEGLDVRTISKGEAVDLKAALAEGKYTVIDFGARWCAPCHDVAAALAAGLAQHPDLAVRAVLIEGATAEESYRQPVIEQHLKYAPGIPFLLVYSPDGKVIHKGTDVAKALEVVDRHRARGKKGA